MLKNVNNRRLSLFYLMKKQLDMLHTPPFCFNLALTQVLPTRLPTSGNDSNNYLTMTIRLVKSASKRYLKILVMCVTLLVYSTPKVPLLSMVVQTS